MKSWDVTMSISVAEDKSFANLGLIKTGKCSCILASILWFEEPDLRFKWPKVVVFGDLSLVYLNLQGFRFWDRNMDDKMRPYWERWARPQNVILYNQSLVARSGVGVGNAQDWGTCIGPIAEYWTRGHRLSRIMRSFFSAP